MYSFLRSLVVRLLRAPTEPPHVPTDGYRSVQVVRASPRFLTYQLLPYSIGCVAAVVAFVIALAATAANSPWWASGLVAFVGIATACIMFVSWFAIRIDYDMRFYVITDRSLRVREGAWTVTEMTLTYANVQNVRIEQGPLQRLFGISDLVVDTAGGGAPVHHRHQAASGHNVTLAGLDHAHEVRDLILAHVKTVSGTSGLGDMDDARHASRKSGGSATSSAARDGGTSPELLAAVRDVRTAAAELRWTAESLAPRR